MALVLEHKVKIFIKNRNNNQLLVIFLQYDFKTFNSQKFTLRF